MPSCLMCNRSRNSSSKQQNITFHKFPTNAIVKSKWHEFVTQNGFNVNDNNKHSLLCSNHFDPSLFVTLGSCRRLQKNAVPNILITRVKCAKTVYPEISKVCQSTSVTSLKCNRFLVKLPLNKMPSENQIEKISTKKKALSQLNVSMQLNNSFQISLSNSLIQNRSVQVPFKNIHCDRISLLDDSKLPKMSIGNDTETSFIQKNMSCSFLEAATSTVDDTPRKLFLKHGICKLSDEIKVKNKKLRALQQTIRRKDKQIDSLKTIILKLKKRKPYSQRCI